MKSDVGPPPFRQAQGPERVEGLVGGPFPKCIVSRRPGSAKAPPRRSKRRRTHHLVVPDIMGQAWPDSMITAEVLNVIGPAPESEPTPPLLLI